ncbi:hypothetical protein YC2023_081167 [Brassica napus]
MSGMNFISDLRQRSLCGRWVKVIKLWKQYSAAGGETREMSTHSAQGADHHLVQSNKQEVF